MYVYFSLGCKQIKSYVEEQEKEEEEEEEEEEEQEQKEQEVEEQESEQTRLKEKTFPSRWRNIKKRNNLIMHWK